MLTIIRITDRGDRSAALAERRMALQAKMVSLGGQSRAFFIQLAAFIPEVAAVQAHIDVLSPVTAQVTVPAPTPVAINMTIALTPSTQAVKDAVQAELADLLQREAKPGGTILISHIREAISLSAGETICDPSDGLRYYTEVG